MDLLIGLVLINLKISKRDKFEDLLRNLTTEKTSIGQAMIFCIEHADCAEEIVECIVEALSITYTPLNKKVIIFGTVGT